MKETGETYHNPELAERRLLTEASHFLNHMDEHGNVPESVFRDVAQNRATGSCEAAMPDAVTTTQHEVVYRIENGQRRRVIMWLGYTATQMAARGRLFHFSPPAFERVDIEEAAAGFIEENLRPGVAQPLISPALSVADARLALARAEHLGDDDSLQVSTAVTDLHGEVVGRKFQSLLVRDIPFDAWTTMLRDPANIFGTAFSLRDEQHATSVMELFSQMELSTDALPEGPVSLVAAVLPYIQDQAAARSVREQLQRFRERQAFYAAQAERAGHDWALFDLELARSLQTGAATEPILSFLLQNAGHWNEEAFNTIRNHAAAEGGFAMTTAFAALLARAKQKLVGDELAVLTDNAAATHKVTDVTRAQIKANRDAIEAAQRRGADPQFIYQLEQQQYGLLHGQQIDSGAGCLGAVSSAFGDGSKPLPERGVGESHSPFVLSDRKGSRDFTCARGHANFRRVANVTEDYCQVCFIDVSCRPPRPAKLTWEEAFGIKPRPVGGLRTGLGKGALVGSGKP